MPLFDRPFCERYKLPHITEFIEEKQPKTLILRVVCYGVYMSKFADEKPWFGCRFTFNYLRKLEDEMCQAGAMSIPDLYGTTRKAVELGYLERDVWYVVTADGYKIVGDSEMKIEF